MPQKLRPGLMPGPVPVKRFFETEAMRFLNALKSQHLPALRNLFGHHSRRIWNSSSRAHIELRGLSPLALEDFSTSLVAEIEACDGVIWAEVNGVLGRVIVSYDPARITLEELVETIEAVEERYDIDEEIFTENRPEHPGDDEPAVRALVRIGADITGVALALTLKQLRGKPNQSSFDFAALMALLENVPHLRNSVIKRVGFVAADFGLGLSNAFVQAIGSGPTSPLIDIPNQIMRFAEARARQRVWAEREHELCADPQHATAFTHQLHVRPKPMPDGPIERYGYDAWRMSLGGFIVGLADTQDFKRAATPLLDALPKPTRFGREGFSTQLGRALAARNIIALDSDALRRLDRINYIIVDDEILYTTEFKIDHVQPLTDIDITEAYHQAQLLFQENDPDVVHEANGWTLAPVARLKMPISTQIAQQADALENYRLRTGPTLALVHKRQIVALLRTRHTLHPEAENLVNAIRRTGLYFILATEDTSLTQNFDSDRRIQKGDALLERIRHEQRDNHGVCMLGFGPAHALHAADVSMGLTRPGQRPPWSADLLASHKLEDATFLIEAIAEARHIAEQSVILATAGAAIGAFHSIGGLKKTPINRVMFAVNSASVLALVNGVRGAAALDRRIKPAPRNGIPWHSWTTEKVLQHLESAPEGLSTQQASERMEPAGKSTSAPLALAQAVVKELSNPLTPVLLAGSAVSAIVGSLIDAGIVASVIGINGLIGGLERHKAEQVISVLAKRELNCVDTFRDGTLVNLESTQLVPGDVITLEAGDVVPADCRILESDMLEVDESALSGESLPVEKNASLTFAIEVAERTSMLYEGTSIAAGDVRAVVVATGEDTEMHRAVHRIGKRSLRESGVEARLRQLTDITFPFAASSGAALISMGLFRRQKLEELVGPAVNLAVAAVPEGLPILSTAAQLAAARRLSQFGILVRNPRAMEALGRVDVLCADKTGTLTEGQIQLHSVFANATTCTLDALDGEHRKVVAAALRATPEEPEDGLLPHATDRAILAARNQAGIELSTDSAPWKRLHELPFKSDRSFHAVLGQSQDKFVITLKGAPEEIIARCTQRQRGDFARRLNSLGRESLLEQADQLARTGLRVLAIAEKSVPADNKKTTGITPPLSAKTFGEEHLEQLTFLGFVALSDPLRPTSAAAVERLHRAGVDVIMITGDHASTATRIAADVGLTTDSGLLGSVLTGAEIEAMDDDTLDQALVNIKVVARATPTHKVRIIESLQRSGRTVAMTGDGGNDAPAIRLADVGIALGRYSTSAARDAADLIITDERIETIVEAIAEGRALWVSVRDAVSILVGGNIGEVGYMLGSGLFSREPTMNTRQLLLVNLFTDIGPALAIVLRPPPDVSPEELLHEGPDNSLGDALDQDIIRRAVTTGAAGFAAWAFARTFYMKQSASTIGLLSLVGAQLGQTLIVGKPTRTIVATSLGSAAVLLTLVQIPGISQAIGCRPLGPRGLLTVASATTLATLAAALTPRARAALQDFLTRRKGIPAASSIEPEFTHVPPSIPLHPFGMWPDAIL